MDPNPISSCALSDVVEISHRSDLFEIVTNEQVTQLSRARGGQGFANAAAVLRLTGVRERRICRPGVTSTDLALAVAEELKFRFGLSWQDCPTIGLSHTHTNAASHANLVHALSDALQVRPERIFSINFGCVGFLELLRLGRQSWAQFAKLGPVPVLTVETPDSWHDASDRSFCGIVAAGASGALLHDGPGHQIHQVAVELRESPHPETGDREALFWTERGEFLNFRGEPDNRTVMRMNGGNVFLQGTQLMIDACRAAFSSITPTQQRVIVASHQPSGKMLDAMVSVLRDELPSLEFLNHLSHHANSISSTIPVVLAHLNRILLKQGLQPVRTGDYILLPAAGIAMSHKATHMAQGWAVLEW